MKWNQLPNALLRSPLLWGGLAGMAFFALANAGKITNPLVMRYMAGSWVNYVETGMFFAGVAALILKAIETSVQLRLVGHPLLEGVPAGGQPVDDCPHLLDQLAQAPAPMQQGYLVRRLREAIENVRRRASPAGLEEEIKYLSDLDAVRSQQSYGFVRIVIWAIPIMGFLGTVIGITIAIANLSPEALESSLPTVTAGLGMAFDTTAIALGFSMVLMFGQFAVDRAEQRLLTEVDSRTAAELIGRFQVTGGQHDPHLLAIRRMADTVMQSTQQLVARQAELWQSTIDAAHARWSQLTGTTGKQLESALAVAIERAMHSHADRLIKAETSAAEQNRQQWLGVQQALVRTGEASAQQQRELGKQSDVLLKIVDATRQITDLETALNRNLKELSDSKNFEDMVMSLSAAIHLLSARASGLPADNRAVELGVTRRAG